MWAPAKLTCAIRFRLATEYTSRATKVRRGNISGSKPRDKLVASSWILRNRIPCSSPPLVMFMVQTQIVAFIDRATAEQRGRRFYSKITTSERSTSHSIRRTRKSSTRRCGTCVVHHGLFMHLPMDQVVASSNQPTAEQPGNHFLLACPWMDSVESDWQWRPRTAIEFMQLSTRRKAGFIHRMMQARRGPGFPVTSEFGDAVGISIKSPQIQKPRTQSTCKTHRSIALQTAV